MAVSPSFRDFVEDQLGQVVPVRTRSMFGGLGIYSGDLFFALAADDVLYFKVDDGNRPDFEARGMEPFRPYGDDRTMPYYQVPGDVLEDTDLLDAWAGKALDVARRARAGK